MSGPLPCAATSGRMAANAVPALRRSLSDGGCRLRNFTRALLAKAKRFQDSMDLDSPNAAAAAALTAACSPDSVGLQWTQGKARDDRVNIVVSEERGWVFVRIYDGFNHRRARRARPPHSGATMTSAGGSASGSGVHMLVREVN